MKKLFLFNGIITCFIGLCMSCIAPEKTAGLQIRGGLPNFNYKIEKSEPVSVVFLGGSITNHQGYRVQITDWLKQQYSNVQFTSINSGIGGTGSDLGVFRTERDVLQYHPDLVFIEFAVNDAKTDSLVIVNSMEGIVRKIWHHNPHTDICFLYALNEPMLDDLRAGKNYRSVRYMETIADYYDISSVNFADDVLKLLNDGKLVFKGDSKKENDGKIVFSNDGTHPTYDGGHPIYTKTLRQSLLQMNRAQQKAHVLKSPLYAGNYEKAKMIPITDFEHSKGWKILSKDDKAFSYFQGDQKVLPVVLESSDPEDFIKVHFKGIRVGVFDLIGPSSGGMTVEIDQNDPFYIRRFDKYCGDRNRTNYCLFESLNDEEHTVILRPDNRGFEKAEIYRTNPKRISETEYFNEFNTYLGYILLVGEVIPN